MLFYLFGSIMQWISCCVLAVGIGIEIHYEANIGFLAITLGSAIFAAATKTRAAGKDKLIRELTREVKYYRGKNRR